MTKAFLKHRTRITILSSFVLIFWAILVARLFLIQVVGGEEYRQRGKRQAQVKETIPATRGIIRDRNALALTSNVIHYSIGVHPAKLKDQAAIAAELSSITGNPEQQYLTKMQSDKSFVYLERNIIDPACESLLLKQ